MKILKKKLILVFTALCISFFSFSVWKYYSLKKKRDYLYKNIEFNKYRYEYIDENYLLSFYAYLLKEKITKGEYAEVPLSVAFIHQLLSPPYFHPSIDGKYRDGKNFSRDILFIPTNDILDLVRKDSRFSIAKNAPNIIRYKITFGFDYLDINGKMQTFSKNHICKIRIEK